MAACHLACLPPPAASRGLPRPDLQNHPARMTPRTGREPTSSVCRVAWGFGSLIALFSFAVWCCLPVISGQCLLPQGASGRHWKICSLQRMAFDFMFFFFFIVFLFSVSLIPASSLVFPSARLGLFCFSLSSFVFVF